MMRFRWLLVAVVALTHAAGVQGQTPEGGYAPQTQSTPTMPDHRVQRLQAELMTTWRMLWSCGEYQEAQRVAAHAVCLFPDSIDCQHALAVAQVVNMADANVNPFACRPPCAASCSGNSDHMCHAILLQLCGHTAKPANPPCCHEPNACPPCCPFTFTGSVAADCCACVAAKVKAAAAPCACCTCAKPASTCGCGKTCACAKPACCCGAKCACAKTSACACCDNCGCKAVTKNAAVRRFIRLMPPLPPYVSEMHIPGTSSNMPTFVLPMLPPPAHMHPPMMPYAHSYPFAGPPAVPTPYTYSYPVPYGTPAEVLPPPLPVLPPAPPRMPGYPVSSPVPMPMPAQVPGVPACPVCVPPASPPLCPVLQCEVPQYVTPQLPPRPADSLRVVAKENGIHVKGAFFEAHCDSVTLQESHNRVVLLGNVRIDIRRPNQPARIEAHHVVVDLHGQAFDVSSAPPPPANATPAAVTPATPVYAPQAPTAPAPSRPRKPQAESRWQAPTPSSAPTPTAQHVEQYLHIAESLGAPFHWLIKESSSHLTPVRVHGGIEP